MTFSDTLDIIDTCRQPDLDHADAANAGVGANADAAADADAAATLVFLYSLRAKRYSE